MAAERGRRSRQSLDSTREWESSSYFINLFYFLYFPSDAEQIQLEFVTNSNVAISGYSEGESG